ncbi:Crp/Fnr family transcriptional regulator [Aggregatimonas sangjinii]|uniref:Crp/Fnr family transcriptional regulator n=1 Tax=Aggregatimonas sangjinii TaxID=2583587 RepID=A0A5B7SMR7_9FLAO|nr:Crp/Fnr family transcriptional regulator [Aggregatimonas sangjinii]QCW99431.1 Crp/Fnr family transcriptional regulator [Aggregatimonas sangjinii]
MKAESQILRNTLNQFNILTDDEFEQFLNVTDLQQFKKKEYLLRQGNYHSGLFFVIEGVVGLYELMNDKEVYLDFFLTTSFATDLESLTSQTVARKNLVALDDCKTFFLSRKELLKLYDVSPAYERLGRKMLEHIVTQQRKLTSVIKTLSPKEQYEYIENNRPELLQMVSLSHLASYLGLARETLSRIRAKG